MSKKKEKIRREIGSFMRQYERKAYPGWDPNDRQYDRKMEKQIKNMDPAELSEIISGDGSDITAEIDEMWFGFKPISGVKFRFNETVEIINGKHRGQKGAVISLIAINPKPRYLVELSTGEEINALESQLKSS